MEKTELYDDEDLGLDDVEYFKEYLKFKKSRALLKAKEAQAAAQLAGEKNDSKIEIEGKPAGATSSPSAPKPPKLPGFIPVPPVLATSQKKENGTAAKNDKDPEW